MIQCISAFLFSLTDRFEFEANVIFISCQFLILCFVFSVVFIFFLVNFVHRVCGTAGGYGILCSQTTLFLFTQHRAQTH